MSTTHTRIGELDVVALLNPIDGWPAGTEGTIVHESRSFKMVEISNEFGETLAVIDVTDDQIRLVWKCPPSDPGD